MTIYCQVYEVTDHKNREKLNVLNPLLPFQPLSYPNALVYKFSDCKIDGLTVNRQSVVKIPETSKIAVSGTKGLTTAHRIESDSFRENRGISEPLLIPILREFDIDIDRSCDTLKNS
jgi:hypothetical protein